jgi:electron transport complex protein RnfA
VIDGAKVLALFIGGVLTDNLVFSRFFAGRAALGEDKFRASILIGMSVALIIATASIVNGALYFFILSPLKLTFLSMVIGVVVTASTFFGASRYLKAKNPFNLGEPTAMHALIAANTIVLGTLLLGTQAEGFLYGALTGVFGGAGFLLAVVLLAGVRERIALSDVPQGLKGLPINLVTAGLIALALMGFTGFGR